MSLVDTFTHLKDRPRADQALAMLQRVASLVKPIMQKRGWRLPLLAEFFPDNPSLLGLNVNGGQKIFIRLRPAHSPDRFFDEEEVIGTMLHELTHNVHGPHDDAFYKYLKGLEDEYYTLRSKGYSGEGFHSNGRRVGQGVSHDLPPHLARQKALEAAQKRASTSRLLSSGSGRTLGGGSMINKTPRQLAAEAAERRARDAKACASDVPASEAEQIAIAVALSSQEHNAEEAEQIALAVALSRDEIKSVDLDSRIDAADAADFEILQGSLQTRPSSSTSPSSPALQTSPGAPDRAPRTASAQVQSRPSSSKLGTTSSYPYPSPQEARTPKGGSVTGRTSPSSSVSAYSNSIQTQTPSTSLVAPDVPDEWECTTCTLVNRPMALQCDACGSVRTWSATKSTTGSSSISGVGLDHNNDLHARTNHRHTNSSASSLLRDPDHRNTNHNPWVQREDPSSSRFLQQGWVCHTCGEGGNEHQFWTCRVCGTVKLDSSVAA